MSIEQTIACSLRASHLHKIMAFTFCINKAIVRDIGLSGGHHFPTGQSKWTIQIGNYPKMDNPAGQSSGSLCQQQGKHDLFPNSRPFKL